MTRPGAWLATLTFILALGFEPYCALPTGESIDTPISSGHPPKSSENLFNPSLWAGRSIDINNPDELVAFQSWCDQGASILRALGGLPATAETNEHPLSTSSAKTTLAYVEQFQAGLPFAEFPGSEPVSPGCQTYYTAASYSFNRLVASLCIICRQREDRLMEHMHRTFLSSPFTVASVIEFSKAFIAKQTKKQRIAKKLHSIWPPRCTTQPTSFVDTSSQQSDAQGAFPVAQSMASLTEAQSHGNNDASNSKGKQLQTDAGAFAQQLASNGCTGAAPSRVQHDVTLSRGYDYAHITDRNSLSGLAGPVQALEQVAEGGMDGATARKRVAVIFIEDDDNDATQRPVASRNRRARYEAAVPQEDVIDAILALKARLAPKELEVLAARERMSTVLNLDVMGSVPSTPRYGDSNLQRTFGTCLDSRSQVVPDRIVHYVFCSPNQCLRSSNIDDSKRTANRFLSIP
ncbi:hypothetical protein SeLEV6574_g07701 [Synchytrium endobioticum]|uniref:Uncharacterized protein n=1 Tax=Synchytrium endobioticum TaxID=286115 RepID=A0A507CJZ7_9FUNG|nr:hypothetical protein SeLEV6574_g07701 [Synchytrium endobioticum]